MKENVLNAHLNPRSLFLNKFLMTVYCIVTISSLKKVNQGFQIVRFQLKFYCIDIPNMHIITLLKSFESFTDSSLFDLRFSLYGPFHVRYKRGRIGEWEERMKSAKWKSNPGRHSTALLHICYGQTL